MHKSLRKIVHTGCMIECLVVLVSAQVFGQHVSLLPKHFFNDDAPILRLVVAADIKELQRNRYSDNYRDATVTFYEKDSLLTREKVLIRPRGEFRRELCHPSQFMIDFKTSPSSKLYKLGKLKLVHACEDEDYYNQLLLKEYLVYKMYNQLTPLSFRVRLVELSFIQSGKTNESKRRLAFFIEDVDKVAARNDCREISGIRYSNDQLSRNQATKLFLFQFMIGNTDWAVPLFRNLKLVAHEQDTSCKSPIAIPYDFDYCGMVNARYAVPYEALNISSVTQRVYRGQPRNMEELKYCFQLLRQSRSAFESLLNNCNMLEPYVRNEMHDYLNSFFSIIHDENKVKHIFLKAQ